MPLPFRIAFVGVDHPHGAGWRESLQNLAGEAEITAIVPCLGGTTHSLEERNAAARRFETVEQLIAEGCTLFDGAIVCLPNSECPSAVTTLARAGKHVLVEKPGAGSAADARPMVATIRAAGVAFQSGYLWRYDEGAQRLRTMIADGRFGRLISVEMGWVTSDVGRRGAAHYLFDPAVSQGGFFNWLACHWLDLLIYLSADSIKAVTARVGQFGAVDVEVEDGGAAILELAGGALATFVGGYWLPRWAGEVLWTIRGSERWVHWDPQRAKTAGVLTIHGPQPQFQAMNEVFAIPADDTPGYGGRRTMALLRDWIEAARTGRDCRNSPESLLATLELLDAIYESSRAGKRVECDIGDRLRS
ncbi:MAG: Gfo/Idh/MocA family oxidoreductase [Planctomycetaceae bacterium]|nr:Gfo/Idh/MocA family oxidoreductase [Planctomycetaceae bacterium]